MLTHKRIAVVGSREFKNYRQLQKTVDLVAENDDILVSGGAVGADSMAQRWAKENGRSILIIYPKWHVIEEDREYFDRGAGFKRNEQIVRNSDLVLAFYRKGHFQEGGTKNTADWARKLGVELQEYEEE